MILEVIHWLSVALDKEINLYLLLHLGKEHLLEEMIVFKMAFILSHYAALEAEKQFTRPTVCMSILKGIIIFPFSPLRLQTMCLTDESFAFAYDDKIRKSM